MPMQEFKKNFCLKIKTPILGVTLIIITKSIRRIDKNVLGLKQQLTFKKHPTGL